MVFDVQKLVSFIRSHWFMFVFIYVSLRDSSEKIFVRLISKNVLCMFPSKNLMVYCHTVKYLSHYDFIFVHGVKVDLTT